MPKRSTLRLTIRSIAALPATGSDAFHWDRDLAGFGVRVQRNGRKVYVVQSRGPAGLKRVTLGPVAGEALDQRRREAAGIIDRIKRGLDPIAPEPEPDPTVADLAARCMRAYVKVQCKPKTQSLYRTAIDRHIVPALGTILVKDVRSSHVIELHDRLRDTPAMANHVVSMLSKMYSLAATWELVPHGRNPCKRVRHYREEPRERFLSPDEYRSLGVALREAEADGSLWPPAIAAIRLLMLTGCRKSEILTLQWDDVDRTAGEFPAPRRQAGAAHGAAHHARPEGARRHRAGRRQSLGHPQQEARRASAGPRLLLEPHPGPRRAGGCAHP